MLAFLMAAGYEAAVALEWIHMGPRPGDEASGQAVATGASLLAVLVGIGVAARSFRRTKRNRPAVLIPLAAAAWATAHFFAFDSYYLPSLERFSESGSVAPAWIYVLDACALIVAAAVWLTARAGSALTVIFLVIAGGTVLAMGVGH